MWKTKPVELHRQFRTVTTTETKNPRELFEASTRGDLHWKDVLGHKRVVVLAEAGSGKSFEFETRARLLVEAGKRAVYLTVQDLGRLGLEGALGPDGLDQLARWRAQATEECWIFVDSVDEAKDADISFDTAMRQLAKGIAGYEERANLIISGRFVDWDFLVDPKAIARWVPVPKPPPTAPDLQAMIVDTLHNRKRDEDAVAEKEPEALILLMTSLDPERVERFASEQGIADAAALIAAVEQGQLWRMAGRPLDLEWMVEYWRDLGRLGALHQMMAASLEARLQEPNPQRRKKSTLSIDVARRALNRVGAALVLTGADTISVSGDTGGGEGEPAGLSLERTLSDHSEGVVASLLRRPVFDPAQQGRIRLHSDNEGAVRSFLAARWLQERLAANCPPQAVFDLLFTETYGLRLVRPDMAETAAWLAISRPEIFDEFLARDPVGLLTKGDPGGFDFARRARLLEAALQPGHLSDRRFIWTMRDFVRRIAAPQFDAKIVDWWARYSDDEDARHVLLNLIEAGNLVNGREAARAVAYDAATDGVSQVLASRALLRVGGDDEARAYAAFIAEKPETLPRALVLGALNELFPQFIDVATYFRLVDAIGPSTGDTDGYYPLDRQLSEALKEPADLIAFVEAVVARGEAPTREEAIDEDAPSHIRAFGPLGVVAAIRLLERPVAPLPLCIVDLVLMLNDKRRMRGRSGEEGRLAELLSLTQERRRAFFWRAAAVLKDHPWQKGSLPSFHMMIHMGWTGRLSVADLDWLMTDALDRTESDERGLALATALNIARDQDPDGVSMVRIGDVVRGHADLEATFAAWNAPPRMDPETQAMLAKSEVRRQRHERETKRRDDSWVTFIERLRAHPEELDNLLPQTKDTADSRLIGLYQFLTSRISGRSRYSISDLSAVEPILGPELTAKFGQALMKFARQHTPLVGPERSETSNQTSSFDVMGLAGMSLAAAQLGWLQTADRAEFERAARYALFELNGFPDYFPGLAVAHPDVVRPILEAAVSAQLDGGVPEGYGMLDRLAYADPVLSTLVSPLLMQRMLASELHPGMLAKITAVIVRIPPPENLAQEALAATLGATDLDRIASFLAMAFAADADRAVDLFERKLATLEPADATALCVDLLPRLFGARFRRQSQVPHVSFHKLLSLVEIAYTHVRPGDDIDHPSGKVFSPGPRDAAQDARYALLSLLQKTKGEATYATLMRLAEEGGPISPAWARGMAIDRALEDSCLETWRPEDLAAFERDYERAPTTPLELQELVHRRIARIAHDLLNHKFAQGATLKGLPDENAVQNWLGDRFDSLSANAYTVERESHVVDEKEPDITLTSQGAAVSVAIEVKVVDDMTVDELDAALTDQLCGRYLRHKASRYGVLLLVYQRQRRRGWKLADQAAMQPWSAVLKHIEALAMDRRRADPNGPQPTVRCIDVSTVVPREKKPRG